MANYDFSTLNSSDLEELACDLLNYDQTDTSPIRYKTFKDGKDKGIDFLYSTTINDYEHVGQVKHYYRTGYAGMIQHIKKTEVIKVRKLNPGKYIFCTSVDLSESQVEEIRNTFTPFIKHLNDIYGKKELNRLIENHNQVLENHYKLWLSDFSIIKLILQSELQFRSADFVEHELKKRLRLYVNTSLYDKVQSALTKNKFVIITGQPGVGKTTLAEMLIYRYLAEGYQVNYVLDIKEAEGALTPDASKQIIYFDDFLGSNAVEINKAKGSETRLRSVLRRISRLENKYIVFTTRAHLLNSAVEESEQLRLFNIKAKSSLFELEEYTSTLKRQLLINHIEESNITNDLKQIICSKEICDYVVNHKNFTPRVIEFLTSGERVGDLKPEEYDDFIRRSLESPKEIWMHAYTEQIGENDRLLLNTLLSFGDKADKEELEEAFLKRLEYEVINNNGKKEILAFAKAFKKLEGAFIILKDNTVNFINPSIVDFLLKYLREDKDEVLRIAESAKFASQLTERLFSIARLNEIKMSPTLQERLIDDYMSFVTSLNRNYDLIQLAMVIHKYVEHQTKTDVICEIIEQIDDFEALHLDYSLNIHFREFMILTRSDSRISYILEQRIVEIFNDLVRGETDIEDAIELVENLAESFDVNLNFLDTSDIEEHFDYLFEERIANDIDMLKDYILDESEADDKLADIETLVERIRQLGIDYEANLSDFNIDWYEIAMDNEFARQMAKDD